MQFDRDRRHHEGDPQDKNSLDMPDCIPIFPLPNLVFFPKTYLPLHIFEPRYRDMVTDAAAEGRCVGMALLKEGWEENYYGNPPVFPVGCVGRLVSVQQLEDGRSNILLQGLERYEIVRELHGKRYRRASIALRPQDTTTGVETSMRAELVRVLQDYVALHDDGYRWQGYFPLDGNDELLINSLSTYLDFTPLEQQFLLEAESLRQQAHRLHDLLQFKRHEQDRTRGWS